MTNEELKKLEDDLWTPRIPYEPMEGIKSADYAVPVLGLIFLRFAENTYSRHEAEILEEYERDKGTRMERKLHEIALAKCGFFLPEYARYEALLHLPKDKSMAQALKEAMEGIEEHQDEKNKGILPTQTYFEIEKKKDDILPGLLKTFSDIPKDASGDVFGKIYEYSWANLPSARARKVGSFLPLPLWCALLWK